MRVTLRNCKNIDEGLIEIHPNVLNVKYALNGTGKSTISQAISTFVNNKPLDPLRPFKLRSSGTGNPSIEGVDSIKSVMCFDEKYVSQYTFQSDELVKNSFEVFVKTTDYDTHLNEINQLTQDIKLAFQGNQSLEKLIDDMKLFTLGCKQTKTGLSKKSMVYLGIGRGNKITNIPNGLEPYGAFLKSKNPVEWLNWQIKGENFLSLNHTCCPYCTSGEIVQKRDTVLKVKQEFEPKYVEELKKALDLFDSMTPYFSDDVKTKIEELRVAPGALSDQQRGYLIGLSEEVCRLQEALEALRELGFNTFKGKEINEIDAKISALKIDLTLFPQLNSQHTREQILPINQLLAQVYEKAGILKGEIAKQRNLIKKTIELHQKEIDEFLRYAGYSYHVLLEADPQGTYRLRLRHNDFSESLEGNTGFLSFGERNAFALVLFMYHALRENPDLIILDDPISSFDGNKKFAILNMLFMKDSSFRGKTVLLLTHEFGTVIDTVKVFPRGKFLSNACFLCNDKGILSEKLIGRGNVLSLKEITEANLSSLNENINKLVYLRRLFEINGEKHLGWQLLSNLFKQRIPPILQQTDSKTRDMTPEEINMGLLEIKIWIPDFDYNVEVAKIQNKSKLIGIYRASKTGYEKLQIYRIIRNENADSDVVRKFVNETFHVENDYLFQLNPCDYEVVPDYVVSECDKDIEQVENVLLMEEVR